MEIIDSHTHWGPSVSMGTEVTTEELLRQAEQSNMNRMVIFPFPSTALADEEINERLLDEAKRLKKFIPYYYIPETILQSHFATKHFKEGLTKLPNLVAAEPDIRRYHLVC